MSIYFSILPKSPPQVHRGLFEAGRGQCVVSFKGIVDCYLLHCNCYIHKILFIILCLLDEAMYELGIASGMLISSLLNLLLQVGCGLLENMEKT